jgi:polyisoprenoid-binding protein YceI
LSHSGFDLTQAVNDLIVDDPQTRSDEGPDFQTTVTDAQRAGTRTNMLKPEQLDGEHFSSLRLSSVAITGQRLQPQVTARITIKDHSRDVVVPVKLTSDNQALRVQGEFKILLTDFGITPYSVAMGALKVEDELTIKFALVAAPVPP